jgi:glycosyltransferase involved in cell wall biosynthesis
MEHNILDVNIYFIDKIPKNALPYLYNISSMGSSFVLDKRIKWDNSANKFFDTLAAGKPILINHRGWQADLIEQENCGYVLPAHPTINDVKLFVSYMQKNELLLKQGENAKKIAKECFSLDVAVSKYLKVLSIVNVNNNYAK